MDDFTPKRLVLERQLRCILDSIEILSAYVDDPQALTDVVAALEAVQFCHTEDAPWPCQGKSEEMP